MNKRCPNIVQIDKETHKVLKIMSAVENKTMGDIVRCLVKLKASKDRRRKKMNESIKKSGTLLNERKKAKNSANFKRST